LFSGGPSPTTGRGSSQSEASKARAQAHPEAPKKKSRKSTIYGTFLFLIFQICSQIVANIILFVAIQRFTFAEFVATNPAKDNLCKALSSSNVDKLKMLM
jgi:hypothetical protein